MCIYLHNTGIVIKQMIIYSVIWCALSVMENEEASISIVLIRLCRDLVKCVMSFIQLETVSLYLQ